jgi:GNAT superfamily N-acetyltransferase
VSDACLERLLRDAYVGGGFTSPERAAEIFAAPAVRARGEVLCAWIHGAPDPAGVVVLVLPGGPGADGGEAQIHLLATSPAHRRAGAGRALVRAAMDGARRAGASRMALWTQATMEAAHALYRAEGFVRRPPRDLVEGERRYLCFTASLDPPAGDDQVRRTRPA